MLSSERPMFLDKVVVFLLYGMAMIPFAQVAHLNVGFAILNAYELLLLALCSVFIIVIIKRGVAKEYVGYVCFVNTTFLLNSSYSLVVLDVGFSSWINQTRHFLPFIVACIALLARLYIDKKMLLHGVTFVAAFSAFSAIIIHFFFKGFIAYALSANDELSRIIIEGGRMYWGSAVLALFGLTAWMVERDKYKRKSLGLAVLVILLGAVFTQNRTMLFGFMFFYVFTQLFVFKKSFKPVIYIFVVIFIVGALFFFLASDNMIALLQRRLLLTDARSVEIEHAFSFGRVGLYVQYLDRLRSTFPFGQGLGLPFSYSSFSGLPIFTSDISLISFSVPFGLLGLVLLFVFIAKLFKTFKQYTKFYRNDKISKVFYWLLFTAFIISLNLDVFSRNIFVVYLAVFAVLHFVPSAQRTKQVPQ